MPRVAKVVEPKRQKLREAERHLEQANKQLQEKQDALAAVVARVEDLRKQLGNAQSEQRQLNEQVGDSQAVSRQRLWCRLRDSGDVLQVTLLCMAVHAFSHLAPQTHSRCCPFAM